jgi:hypothetical protein
MGIKMSHKLRNGNIVATKGIVSVSVKEAGIFSFSDVIIITYKNGHIEKQKVHPHDSWFEKTRLSEYIK